VKVFRTPALMQRLKPVNVALDVEDQVDAF
jgi:hypothetical protein